MLRSLDLRPVVASLVELATALGCCASPWSLTPSPTAARSWLPGGVGGSWVLVVEAAGHAAAQLQPVLLELPHACLLVPGRAVCPGLGTRGTVDTVACRKAARGKRRSQRNRPCMKVAGHRPSQVPGWLVGACGWGSGMPATVRPDPSTLGVAGERGSRHESCSQHVPGHSR